MATSSDATVQVLRVTALPTGLSMVFGGRLPALPAGQPPRRPLPETDAEQPRR